eukprot:239702_1
MVREVLSLGIGQCGIQLGSTVWQQYNTEHQILPNGKYNNFHKSGPSKTYDTDESFRVFYQETSNGQFVPRNIFIDLEPNVIDDVKQSIYKDMYAQEFLLSGNED